MELQNFPDIRISESKNLTGICNFWFTDIRNINTYPHLVGANLTKHYTLNGGKSWYRGYFVDQSLKYSSGKSGDRRFVPSFMSGLVGKLTKEGEELFRYMHTLKFIVIFKDNNGIYRSLGYRNHGVSFYYSQDIQGGSSGMNQYGFEFRGTLPFGCHYYLDGINKTESNDNPPVAA